MWDNLPDSTVYITFYTSFYTHNGTTLRFYNIRNLKFYQGVISFDYTSEITHEPSQARFSVYDFLGVTWVKNEDPS